MPLVTLVIQVRDKNNPDSIELDAHNYKEGDVIEVLAPDHKFTEAEKRNPDWRFVRANVPQGALDALTEPEDRTDNPRWQRRRRALDLKSLGLSQATRDYLADDTRAVESIRDDNIVTSNFTRPSRKNETEQEFTARKITRGGR